MSDADREAITDMIAQADRLAARILATDVATNADYRALAGLVSIAVGGGEFAASGRHRAALERRPPERVMTVSGFNPYASML